MPPAAAADAADNAADDDADADNEDSSWLGCRPVLIFDLGGVVLDWNPRHLYRALIPDEAEREWFLAEICSPAWNAQMDAGKPSAEAIAELSAEHPEQAALIHAFWDQWPKMLGGLVPGVAELLADLAADGRDLYAITNFNGEVWPVTQELFPVLDCFKDVIVSSFERLIKPDRRIFDLALRRFGVAPRDCLFIDDVAANVEGARAAGIAAVQFTSTLALRRLLLAS